MRHTTLASLLLALCSPAFAMSTAFTYQGSLEDAGLPANGTFDFSFELLDHQTIVREDVTVIDGLFTVDLDFGPAITMGDYELLVGVRPGNQTGAFAPLNTSTPIRPVPQAQVAEFAGEAASVSPNAVGAVGIIDGSVGAAEINSTEVQRRVAGSCGANEAIRSVAADGSVTCSVTSGAVSAVTAINTGSGLTGGPITSSGTISVASNGITSSHIGDGEVGVFDINVNEVQRRVVGNCPAGSAIRSIANDGSSACTAISGVSWALSGNAGTNASNNFLGTTDAQPLVLRAWNSQVMKLEAVSSSANIAAGSSANVVASGVRGGTVVGGGAIPLSEGVLFFEEPNVAYDHYASVFGGLANRAGSADANPSNARYATVLGGMGLRATAESSTAVGGASNRAVAEYATTVGGYASLAYGPYSVIAGGSGNGTTGTYAAAIGGQGNCAGGAASFAAGTSAKVRPASTGTLPTGCENISRTTDNNGDEGTFVWADASSTTPFVSSGPNKFEVRATGGVRLVTNSASTAGVTLAAGSGSWSSISDRNMKDDIKTVDSELVLQHVSTLPIYTWRYKAQAADIRHMGPMAQDFHAAFKLNGSDDRSIATVDPDGVALAAIQGLNTKLERENAALRARLDAIEAALGLTPKL
ncbi:tail fiber domain-containing protein [Ahniella affigens]|nr:tail fiber domain-containing protein [Ahniella affigens]